MLRLLRDYKILCEQFELSFDFKGFNKFLTHMKK